VNAHVMPVPMMNILNGGKHAANSTTFRNSWSCLRGPSLLPNACAGRRDLCFFEKGASGKGMNTNVGDEGGFAPSLSSNAMAIEVILQAIEKAGYRPGEDVWIALDPASSELYEDGKYKLQREGRELSSDEMVAFYVDWVKNTPSSPSKTAWPR